MARERFALFNTAYGENIALIEMDDSLLLPEAGIVDQETLTLKSIKGGGGYTLIPIEDHTVSTLQRVLACYRAIKDKPCQSMSTMMSRVDNLIEVVGLLFGEVEYFVVESLEDISNILKMSMSPEDSNERLKKIKHDILGDMLAKVCEKPIE